MHFLFGAGGTGGHLYPALAVADALRKIYPDCRITFTGRNDKIESRKVPAFGYDFLPIDIEGFSVRPSLSSIKKIVKLFKARKKLLKFIKKEKCSAVIVAGAYISIPPGFAAATSKTPLFLMESNINPGKAISLLTAKSTAIFTSFIDSKNYFPQRFHNKIFYTGNPIRADFETKISQKEAKSKIGIYQDKKLVLIFGGSLGASSINEFMKLNLGNFGQQNYEIVWQTGSAFNDVVNLPKNIRKFEYIDDMSVYYKAADLIVSRSGASTISEITLMGKPSVLIPLPGASNNEQMLNAKQMLNCGASLLINNDELNSKLFNIVNTIIDDTEKLETMANNAKSLAKPGAANEIASRILEMIR